MNTFPTERRTADAPHRGVISGIFFDTGGDPSATPIPEATQRINARKKNVLDPDCRSDCPGPMLSMYHACRRTDLAHGGRENCSKGWKRSPTNRGLCRRIAHWPFFPGAMRFAPVRLHALNFKNRTPLTPNRFYLKIGRPFRSAAISIVTHMSLTGEPLPMGQRPSPFHPQAHNQENHAHTSLQRPDPSG